MKLYIACIPDLLTQAPAAYFSRLSPERAARAARIRVEESQRRVVCAGLLLSRFFGREEPEYTEFGKPYFPEKPPFSLSHSGDFVVLALGDQALGADVEKLRRADFRLASRFFHPAEYAYLQRCSQPDAVFTQIWTYKEAFLKALGTGLAVRPSSFCLPQPGLPLLYQGEAWYFQEVPLPGYALTLCTRGQSPAAEVLRLESLD